MTDGCHIERLRLYNFRNYAECSVELAPGLNLITGRNAQGKSNLLEAVATLLLTRSPHTATSAELLRWGTDECLVQAHIARSPAPLDVEVRFSRENSLARTTRTTQLNGKPQRARALLGLCPVVLFWPEDLDLIKAGPDGRRRRLDMLLSQLDASAADDLVRYRRVVEQRNSLLRQLREGRANPATLAPYSLQLATLGGRVQCARTALVLALSEAARAALHSISNGCEALQLRYRPDGQPGTATTDPDQAAAAISARLGERQHEELARGVTLAGPHRDDLEFRLGDRTARGAASQGQQRSIVLALTLAEVEHIQTTLGVSPTLLLDDVLSELDSTRREALLEFVSQRPSLQVLVTTAEPSVVDSRVHTRGRRLVVDGGRVTASDDYA